jgi:hypothetical protein
MLFMVMHKMTPELEKGLPPDPAIIQKMGNLIGEAQRDGIFHNAAGLRKTADRVRLKCTGGKCVQSRGPFQGTKELIDGFVILKVPGMDEAIEWATRIAGVIGDIELDVGPVVEPWDLGLMAKPAQAPLRVMVMSKADAASESGASLPVATRGKLDALVASMKEAGVFLAAEKLQPSSRGARLKNEASGKRTWTDGPFTETKELISGFTILRLSSQKDARAWTERYADILGDIEVDVREVLER